jgi:hypothetical protein
MGKYQSNVGQVPTFFLFSEIEFLSLEQLPPSPVGRLTIRFAGEPSTSWPCSARCGTPPPCQQQAEGASSKMKQEDLNDERLRLKMPLQINAPPAFFYCSLFQKMSSSFSLVIAEYLSHRYRQGESIRRTLAAITCSCLCHSCKHYVLFS